MRFKYASTPQTPLLSPSALSFYSNSFCTARALHPLKHRVGSLPSRSLQNVIACFFLRESPFGGRCPLTTKQSRESLYSRHTHLMMSSIPRARGSSSTSSTGGHDFIKDSAADLGSHGLATDTPRPETLEHDVKAWQSWHKNELPKVLPKAAIRAESGAYPVRPQIWTLKLCSY